MIISRGNEMSKLLTAHNDKENLCDTCDYCIAECGGEVEFGTGDGSDNVIECDSYSGSEAKESKDDSRY